MQKSGIPKMRHYAGFSQIGSQMLDSQGHDYKWKYMTKLVHGILLQVFIAYS